jgi:hypothetical protein
MHFEWPIQCELLSSTNFTTYLIYYKQLFLNLLNSEIDLIWFGGLI